VSATLRAVLLEFIFMVMGEKSFVALLVLGLFEATISHTFVSRRMVFGGSASALILGTGESLMYLLFSLDMGAMIPSPPSSFASGRFR
jgi:hypothetical protein